MTTRKAIDAWEFELQWNNSVPNTVTEKLPAVDTFWDFRREAR